ncbi:MAG: lipopolysaccharide biosynthesis protein [Thiobacillus sp.]
MSASPYSGNALKRSALHFLVGKAMSAFLTLLVILWLVRALPVAQYGAYVTLVAGMELIFGLSGLGLSWMAVRYLPEYRLHAKGVDLARLATRLIVWQGLSLLCFALALFISIEPLLEAGGLSSYRGVAELYLLVLLVEGLGRQIRECILGGLLQQASAQLSQAMRSLTFLCMLALITMSSSLTLIDVVKAELAASILAAVIALVRLAQYLIKHRKSVGQPGWQAPKLIEMWHTAFKMYLSEMLTMLYSPQVLTILVQRHLGLESAAVFGFMRSLYEQIARYLPATLLMSLIRPKLVASYVSSGGMEELARNANLAGKLSLFVLMPLVAFSGVVGQEIIGLLSGARFNDTGMFFFGFMLVLIPYSQRQILETIAVAAGQGSLCTRAAFSGLLILPMMYVLLLVGVGLWAAIISLGMGYLVFNGILLFGISKKLGYRADFIGLRKLVVSALAGYLMALPLSDMHSVAAKLVGAAFLVAAVFLAVAYVAKPFAAEERARINRLINRRLFVW